MKTCNTTNLLLITSSYITGQPNKHSDTPHRNLRYWFLYLLDNSGYNNGTRIPELFFMRILYSTTSRWMEEWTTFSNVTRTLTYIIANEKEKYIPFKQQFYHLQRHFYCDSIRKMLKCCVHRKYYQSITCRGIICFEF